MDALLHPLLEPGRLLLVACPGRTRRYVDEALDEDLGALRAEGVGRVVCLLPEDELEGLGVADIFDALYAGGFAQHHLPIVDGSIPGDVDALLALLGELETALADGETVAIHCRAGLGRTGTIAAAVLIARGLPPSDAIVAVREARPGAIENSRQEAFLHQLAQTSR